MRKKILLLSIFIVGIMAITSVSAAENATDDIVSLSNDNQTISVENNQDSLNTTEPTVLEADSSLKKQSQQSNVSDTVEVVSAASASKVKNDKVLSAVKSDSSKAKQVLKSGNIKVVKMFVKYKWVTKKIGKYKVQARLWKVRYAYGYLNYLDIILYKNGKQLKCGNYISKYLYKDNGRWKWWSKWRHGGVNHAYHRYINDRPIRAFMVVFKY